MKAMLINKKTGNIISIGKNIINNNKDLIVIEISKEFPQGRLKNELYYDFKNKEVRIKTNEMILNEKKEIAKRQLNELIIINLYQFFIDETKFKNKISDIIKNIDNSKNQNEIDKIIEDF